MSKKKITHPERSMEELIARAVEAAKAPFTPSRKAELVDSIAIFGISSIPIFRIEKDMVFPPFGKRYFLNVIEFSGLSVTG